MPLNPSSPGEPRLDPQGERRALVQHLDTLGIPHQPGTPLYVLVGHAFSLLPLGIGIAHKINLMSAFFSALAVTFMYLAAVRLQRNWGDDPSAGPVPAWIGRAGAATDCWLWNARRGATPDCSSTSTRGLFAPFRR